MNDTPASIRPIRTAAGARPRPVLPAYYLGRPRARYLERYSLAGQRTGLAHFG